ncbi:hypothetical protein [Streptomyces xanthochromogenes]
MILLALILHGIGLSLGATVLSVAVAALLYAVLRRSGSGSASGAGGSGAAGGGRADSDYRSYRARRDRMDRWERRYRRERQGLFSRHRD